MSDEEATGAWRCRECGRENPLWAQQCWFCSNTRPVEIGITTTPRAPPEVDEDYPGPSDQLEVKRQLARGVITGLYSACFLFGLGGVGFALLLALTPAFYHLRAIVNERSARAARGRDNVLNTCSLTMAAFGIVFLVFISSLIAFVGVLSATLPFAIYKLGDAPILQILLLVGGLVGGLVISGAVGYGIVRAFFRRQRVE